MIQIIQTSPPKLLSITDCDVEFISIVIPVFRAEDCLLELYQRIIKSLEALNVLFEIIMVEDCGGDNSWGLIQEFAGQDHRLKGFKLSRNFGQHNAITAGLAQVRGQWAIIMDCDLQDKPEDIWRLIEKTYEGHDVVIARSILRHDSWVKRVTSNSFYLVLSWLAGYKYEKGVRPFRIMSRGVIEALQEMGEQTRTLGPLMEWVGFSPAYIDVEVEQRLAGQSSYSWTRLMDLAFGTILAFSNKPLRVSISIGFTMAGCAFTYGLYTVIRALWHDIPVPGWTSLITSLYFIGGLILANLGIVGLYLGKTFEETKGRPLYLIARRTMPDGSNSKMPLSPRRGR